MTVDESRLNRMLDEAEVRALIVAVARITDEGDIEDYAKVLCDDATWQLPGGAVVTGAKEIIESAQSRRAARLASPDGQTRHVVSNTEVVVTGDEASARTYWQYFGSTDTAPTLKAFGNYADSFRRTPDGWRFAGRFATSG
jgi:3-phenylpropionate/cinnamic acid dioxygenase small subunit